MPHPYKVKIKICEYCHQNYQPTITNQKYCGSAEKKTGCSYRNYKEYKREHPGKYDEYGKTWRKANRKRAIDYSKRYRKEHPEQPIVDRQKRRARISKVGGSFSGEQWLELKKLFNWTCYMCFRKEPVIQLTVDHKIPLSKGGTNNIDNIQPLCHNCNSSKRTNIWFASCSLERKAVGVRTDYDVCAV